MCVSTDEAEFSGTILYTGRRHHPEHGLINVLGYQNTAVNLAEGPNAMLLHVPARQGMTPENFIAVGRHGDVLTRMVDAVARVAVAAGSTDWMGSGSQRAVQIFEHDIYTVLLATDPTLLPAALGRVPLHKRLRLSAELMEFYADLYQCHTIMVCCFDNAEAQRAKPLLVWYEPEEPDRLVLPALDCHTGDVPSLDETVTTDHWVLSGTDEATADWGTPVDYPASVRHKLRDFLPDTVIGDYIGERLPNGDFAITYDDLLRTADISRVERLQPAH